MAAAPAGSTLNCFASLANTLGAAARRHLRSDFDLPAADMDYFLRLTFADQDCHRGCLVDAEPDDLQKHCRAAAYSILNCHFANFAESSAAAVRHC